MATTTSPIAQHIVNFAVNNTFPDDDNISTSYLTSASIPSAIAALAAARSNLESDIHSINTDTADDVASWVDGAKSLQADILRSKQLANDIVRQAEEPEATGESIRDAEEKVAFLRRELGYSAELERALTGIRDASGLLDEVERVKDAGQVLDALKLLQESQGAVDAVAGIVAEGYEPGGCRAVKLLEIRAFELRNDVHDQLDRIWQTLARFDESARTLSIVQEAPDVPMSLADAVTAIRVYKEVNERMARLWEDLDNLIIKSRMAYGSANLPKIMTRTGTLQVEGKADDSMDTLFDDLDTSLTYLAERLPRDFQDSLSAHMVPVIISRISSSWLDTSIPTKLDEMDHFEAMTASCRRFCNRLRELRYSGLDELQEWVDDAPKMWLTKCRETALDSVRSRLSGGLGKPREIERTETQRVSVAEGKQLVTGTNAVVDGDDWGAAWGDEDGAEDVSQPEAASNTPSQQLLSENHQQQDDGADAWGWDDEGNGDAGKEASGPTQPVDDDDDDDPAEAWGWGEDDAPSLAQLPQQPADSSTKANNTMPRPNHEQRDITLKETYTISAMPDPVLQLIYAILEDGATLVQSENNPVAAAAAGLFQLPTLALAMFRAASPYYYSLDIGGNMYLYNDTTYLAEQLTTFTTHWKSRADLNKRARLMLRLDNDIKTLRNFSSRAYTNEMSTQKLVLRDLLGGEQSLIQQDELESCVDAAIARIRSLAVTWEHILARSAWYQAVGALVDCVAGKIIGDVMDASGISQDDAYAIAKLIASVTELDDLFLPGRVIVGPPNAGARTIMSGGAEEMPLTVQYVPLWFRLKYLSEVLQSDLRDVRYLWMESELSLYFTQSEVVELVNLSFEDNARTREVLKEVMAHPTPMDGRE